ncbi:hypothetical protein ASA1KI_18830 [Opitutales bacterium ASA1]|uniref:hypothetical protein n=1 Tax=Congregicoccus parvus TaxID=3081749 RepID=UPI002B2D8504|nr:hypothetical protein ASA1KI_18830 [Opitutales bacterium ASA1]
MRDNQYQLFRDLDRRCVAGGMDAAECAEAVRLKRASIDSDRMREIPLVRDVLEGRTTFVAAYDRCSRALRGLRRFVPRRHDGEWNDQVAQLGAVVPNVSHFRRRSLFALDNPVACTIYGLAAAAGVAVVLAHASREDDDVTEGLIDAAGGGDVAGQSFVMLFLLFGIVGFTIGSYGMLKYRTRDSKTIHAREAATYMDVNYGYYRNGDDAAWAACIRKADASAPETGGRIRATVKRS